MSVASSVVGVGGGSRQWCEQFGCGEVVVVLVGLDAVGGHDPDPAAFAVRVTSGGTAGGAALLGVVLVSLCELWGGEVTGFAVDRRWEIPSFGFGGALAVHWSAGNHAGYVSVAFVVDRCSGAARRGADGV